MRSYLSPRRLLTLSLLAMALLAAPAGAKDKDKKVKPDKKYEPLPPATLPPAVPEFDGSHAMAAAVLLGGSFLLLAARRRSASN